MTGKKIFSQNACRLLKSVFPGRVVNKAALKTEVGRLGLEAVLLGLTKQERKILRLRYGLDDGYVYAVEDVGSIFKVTRERVLQLESSAIRKLRQPMRARALEALMEKEGELP